MNLFFLNSLPSNSGSIYRKSISPTSIFHRQAKAISKDFRFEIANSRSKTDNTYLKRQRKPSKDPNVAGVELIKEKLIWTKQEKPPMKYL